MTYLRFVVDVDAESAHPQDGLFTELIRLKNEDLLMEYQYSLINKIFKYFNDNLSDPPYNRKNLPKEAVAWFNPHYSQFIYSKAKLTAVYGNAQKY